MTPRRGDVWFVDFGNPVGHEQGLKRPCAILSTDVFNAGAAGLVVVVPATTSRKRIPLHVEVLPPEGGLVTTSYFKPEDIRSVSTQRLEECWGRLSSETTDLIADRVRLLLDL